MKKSFLSQKVSCGKQSVMRAQEALLSVSGIKKRGGGRLLGEGPLIGRIRYVQLL